MEENKDEGLNDKELNDEKQVSEQISNEELNGEKQVLNSDTEGEKSVNKFFPILATVLVGVVAVAIVLLIVISLISPKNTFFRLVNNSFSDISKGIDGIKNNAWGNLLSIDATSKLDIDTVMKATIKTDDAEIKEYFQGLESFELKANEKADFSNDYTNTNASFILNGENFWVGNLIKNKNIVSLKVDNVTDGYVTVDNNNLSEFWEKIGYTNGPMSIDNSLDVLKNINFSKKDISDLKDAIEKFGSGFSKAFDDDDFSYSKGYVESDEATIECKTMDFHVDPIDFNSGLVNGLEEISSKPKYIDVLYKIISTLDKVSGYEPLTREEFGTNFEEMVQQIRSLEFSEQDEGFILRIFYKGNDILKVEMLSEDYNTKIISFTAINNGDSAYYKYSEGISVYEDSVTTIDNITTHSLKIDYIDYETGEILEGYGSEITIKIDNTNKDESNINFIEKVRLVSYDENFENLDIMSINPTVVRDYTFKCKVTGDENKVDVIMIDGDDLYSSTFEVNSVITESVNFENTTVNDNENFDTTKKTDAELVAKKDKIIQNWNSNIANDKNKVRQFETAMAMYLSMFIPANYSYDDGAYEDITNLQDLEYYVE